MYVQVVIVPDYRKNINESLLQARFDGEEYVLGQIFEGQSKEENARLLWGEFENLVQDEAFWEGFNELALEYETSLPCKSNNS